MAKVAVRRAVQSSPLLTGLVSYWSFDEASGNRVDCIAGNDWVVSPTLGYDAGLTGNAVKCVQGSLDNGVLNPCPAALDFAGAQSFTVALWMYEYTRPDPSPSYHRLIYHAYETVDGGDYVYHGYGLMAVNNAVIAAYIGNGKSAAGPWIHAGDGSDEVLPLNTWHWLLLEHNATTQVATVYLNTVAGETRACPAGWQSALTQPITLGATNVGPPDNTFDGLIDEVGIWNRVLTAGEKTWLYNGGAGRSYAEIAAYVG